MNVCRLPSSLKNCTAPTCGSGFQRALHPPRGTGPRVKIARDPRASHLPCTDKCWFLVMRSGRLTKWPGNHGNHGALAVWRFSQHAT
jgi:hypothetical protein